MTEEESKSRKQDGQVARRHEPAGENMSRRRMLGLVASSLVGTGLALPLEASAAKVKPSSAKTSAPEKAAAGATPPEASNWKPQFLDAHQVATLIALERQIAPGAEKAKAHEFIDLLLSVIPAEAGQDFCTGNSVPISTVSVEAPARQLLLNALGAFDSQALRDHNQPFLKLTAAQQNAMLAAADAASEDSLAHRQYLAARNWILGAYYSTEAGIRELGWTGMLAFPKFVGCNAV